MNPIFFTFLWGYVGQDDVDGWSDGIGVVHNVTADQRNVNAMG